MSGKRRDGNVRFIIAMILIAAVAIGLRSLFITWFGIPWKLIGIYAVVFVGVAVSEAVTRIKARREAARQAPWARVAITPRSDGEPR